MKNREKVLEYITNNPGCTPGQMNADIDLTARTIRNIAKKLEGENLIKTIHSFQDMRTRHYYPNGVAEVCAIVYGVSVEI